MDIFWKLLGLLAGGIASNLALIFTFAFLLPVKYGDKIIGFFFDRKLAELKDAQNAKIEAFKADQTKELESLKAKIAHLTDRGIRSNEREYQALAAIWEKYVDLHYATNVCVVGFSQFPDLNKYNSEELNNYLEGTDFSEIQKRRIREADDKITSASTIQSFRQINAAQIQIYEIKLLMNKLGIFVPADIRKLFDNPTDTCFMAIAQRYAS